MQGDTSAWIRAVEAVAAARAPVHCPCVLRSDVFRWRFVVEKVVRRIGDDDAIRCTRALLAPPRVHLCGLGARCVHSHHSMFVRECALADLAPRMRECAHFRELLPREIDRLMRDGHVGFTFYLNFVQGLYICFSRNGLVLGLDRQDEADARHRMGARGVCDPAQRLHYLADVSPGLDPTFVYTALGTDAEGYFECQIMNDAWDREVIAEGCGLTKKAAKKDAAGRLLTLWGF